MRLSAVSTFMDYSRDGKLLAVPYGKTVRLFDATTGQLRRTLRGHTGRVYRVVFSPNSQILVSCSDEEKEVKLWDVVQDREPRILEGHEAGVLTLAFSPDGKVLASAGRGRRILLWKVSTGEDKATLLLPAEVTNWSLGFHPDGKILVSASSDGMVRLWDLEAKELRSAFLHDQVTQDDLSVCRNVTFSADGRLLATSSDLKICLWDSKTSRNIWSVPGAGVGLTAFSPDGKTLLTGGHIHTDLSVHTVTRWNVVRGEKQATLTLRSQAGYACQSLSPDGGTLAGGGGDFGTVVGLYDADTGRPRFPETGHKAGGGRIAFSLDGKWLASAGGLDNTAKLWDMATGKEVRTLRWLGKAGLDVRAVAFSPDGKILATGDSDGTVRLWDPVTGQSLGIFNEGGIVDQIAFSPDGKSLASANWDGTVRLYDVARRIEKGKPLRCDSRVASVGFSPDGRLLAAGSLDGIARVLEVESGVLLRTLKHPTNVLSVSFLPEGQTLATGTSDGVARLWSLPDSAMLRELPGWGTDLFGLSVRWDGRLLAASGFDGAVRLWDLSTDLPRRQTFRLSSYGDSWRSGTVFSPEGRHLATGNPDGTIYLFRLGPPGKAALPGLPRPDPVAKLILEFETQQRGDLIHPVLSRDGRRTFSPRLDGTVRVLDVATGMEVQTLNHPKPAICLAVTSDDRFLLSTCAEGIVRIWDLALGREVRQLDGKHSPNVLVPGPDGREVVTLGSDGQFTVVSDITTGKELRRFKGGMMRCVFTPDGKQLLVSRENQLVLVDSRSGAEVRQFAGHQAWIRDVAVSPDGRFGASVSGSSSMPAAGQINDDCSVRVWDLKTGQHLWCQQENAYCRFGVAFTPDGRRVVVGSHDRTIRVYETATGRELACLDCPNAIFGVAVSSDGKSVLARGTDGALRLYSLPPAPEGPPAR